MQVRERRIVILELDNGSAPFDIWFESLASSLQRAVDARLTRIADGNFGDHKRVGEGVFELRILKGPGLRIYYGLKGRELVVLIGGGDKKTQQKDISRAQQLWRKYEGEN